MAANFRQVHVHAWKDEWVLDLEPDEKLLFIYLFTNASTSLAGIYKIAFRVICFETGIDSKRAKEILEMLEQAEKAYYSDGVMFVRNLRKYHETRSDKVQIRIKNDIAKIPDGKIKGIYTKIYPIDTVSLKEEDKDKEEDEKNLPPTPPESLSGPQIQAVIIDVSGVYMDININRLGNVKKLLIDYGEDKTKSGLALALNGWKSQTRKDNQQPYTVYNQGWIDWGYEYLTDGIKRWENGDGMSTLEMLKEAGYE